MPGAVDYAQLLAILGSADFRELRPAQDAALGCYSTGYTTAEDLAVELPTGAGKSLIALLICEAWRREGATVAVLTGHKVLARQMESEGQRLGVPVVRFEGEGASIPLSARRRYRRAEAIAVMNYWVMFNQNPVVDSADLLVIDDAHLAEGALDSLYSVEIDRYNHPALFQSLVQDMAQGSMGYVVRGTIVTHLADLDPAAAASIGTIKVMRKDAVAALWTRVNQLLGAYGSEWSADTPEARLVAADHLGPRLPSTGWLSRTLIAPSPFVETAALLSEWPS